MTPMLTRLYARVERCGDARDESVTQCVNSYFIQQYLNDGKRLLQLSVSVSAAILQTCVQEDLRLDKYKKTKKILQ